MSIQGNNVDRRAEVLSDPAIHESIRTVARLRGMTRDFARDIAQQVLLEALTDENLPLDDKEQTRLYLGGCARHKAIDHVRSTEIRTKTRIETHEQSGRDPETSALAARLWEVVVGRFPGKSDMLFRYLILGETHAEIAGWYRKPPSTVRNDISDMMRALRNTTFVCAFLVVFVGGSSAWHRMTRPVSDSQLSDTTAHRYEAPPVEPTAAQLRDRARDWCRQRVWGECITDIDHAYRLDPSGDTEQWQKLREYAQDELEGGFSAKPGYTPPKNHK
jgi:DNA-directed RNA polymerase specialized sigma24 family protein